MPVNSNESEQNHIQQRLIVVHRNTFKMSLYHGSTISQLAYRNVIVYVKNIGNEAIVKNRWWHHKVIQAENKLSNIQSLFSYSKRGVTCSDEEIPSIDTTTPAAQ